MILEHDTEEWRPVKLAGYEAFYEVSSHGRIRSNHSDRVLKPWRAARMGYWAVHLFGTGKSTKQYIHRLVLLTFVGPCPDGMESCHGKFGIDINTPGNLRWGTRLENSHDLDLHGTRKLGDDHPTSKLSADRVLEIKAFCKRRGDRTKMAEKFNVSIGTINDIMLGKTWCHLKE